MRLEAKCKNNGGDAPRISDAEWRGVKAVGEMTAGRARNERRLIMIKHQKQAGPFLLGFGHERGVAANLGLGQVWWTAAGTTLGKGGFPPA
jgi:hypothetical protein